MAICIRRAGSNLREFYPVAVLLVFLVLLVGYLWSIVPGPDMVVGGL